ncbi:uncharacterized protein MELLADRAFT_84681 [Melampsora larici-populina 98AG31]|uniref:Aquaporin n=1 Tax=Melampsora larici-populina (strain 98AG31 / pathotype 3-4-7) TaxID=747676 RepID=F4RGG2_MELLP|nr:uncharacterized protein MELLADRAFT_84681 [Melampsora larici-populina 98AG31]EGG08501.1 hypothetical protein MELLADRAFT_84681 [Melampsora larici-populina 98AG31]
MVKSTPQFTHRRRPFLPEIITHCIAEFIGVFLYVLPGEAATAGFLLSSASKTAGLGDLLNIGIACGIVLAITLTHVSGPHLSPGVTIAVTVLKGFPLWKVIPYIMSQMLGAIAATLCIYGVYDHSFRKVEQGLVMLGKKNLVISPSGPGGVGAILPGESHDLGHTILGLTIFGALDRNNPVLSPTSIPYLIGMAYLIAIIGFAPNTVVLNTARGLGGQIATSMIYGAEVFENKSFIVMATLTNIPATLLGGLLYKCFLENNDPPTEIKSTNYDNAPSTRHA